MDELAQLWAPLIPWARALLSHAAPGVYVSSGYRSYAHQKKLYDAWLGYRAMGLTNEEIASRYGLYTPSPPGRSMHQHGLAFDLGGPADELEWLGKVWNAWGGLWSPRDRVHFQVKA